MIPFAAAAGLLALVQQFIDFLKELLSAPKSAVTQVVTWAAGIGAVVLFAHSNFGSQVHVGSLALDSASGPSQVLIGLLVSSLGSSLHDVVQAVDNTSSQTKPPLVP